MYNKTALHDKQIARNSDKNKTYLRKSKLKEVHASVKVMLTILRPKFC